jgi:lysophospholipase L1-like esterase
VSLCSATSSADEEKPVRRRLVASVLALTAAAATVGTATSSSASPAPLRYVALGDSYSAASGVLPPDPTAPPSCLRSIRNYPHVIAQTIGAQLTDVTCGGADTGDYAASQSPGVAPQLDALSRGTQLVTMTIGGNDSNVFINSIVECGAAGLSTAGQGSPCKDRYGSSFEDTIRTTTYPSLVKALRAVRHAAPRARIAILSYPWILPRTVGCFDRMPIAQGDVPYLRHEQATLNDAVRRAAAATGTTYVDLNRVSEGHDACQPLGVRWIEPVLQGTNPVIVHPNALGEARMAKQTMTVLGLN